MIWDILVFPFKLVGQVTGWALDLTGHVLGFVVGLVLLILGIARSITVIGLILGIPLIVLGGWMMFKSLFCCNRK